MTTVGTTSLYPLEMNPSRLVVRYGDPVLVNCSTSVADPEGMGWEASQGGTGLVEDVTWLMWTVERLEDWNGKPKCYINLKNGDQPVETLGVTLYREYFVARTTVPCVTENEQMCLDVPTQLYLLWYTLALF